MCWAAKPLLEMIACLAGANSERRIALAHAGMLGGEVLQRSSIAKGRSLSGVLSRDMADASRLVLPDFGLSRSGKAGFLMRCMGADSLGRPSNAFLLCTYWYIEAPAGGAWRVEALELLNTVLGRRNNVSLLSEDSDLKTGELWGNFPQIYSQVGMILSAMRLSRIWEEGLWHAS